MMQNRLPRCSIDAPAEPLPGEFFGEARDVTPA